MFNPDDPHRQSIPDAAASRRALLEKWRSGGALGLGIPRRTTGIDVPLSGAQRRLWIHQRMAPDGPLYHVPIALRARGPIDLGALQQSLASVVCRHEALRTTFGRRGDEYIQHVHAACAVDLAFEDLQSREPDQREAIARALISAEARKPFDLVRGPLFRALVVRLQTDDHFVLLTTHHLVTDGWSVGILLQELVAAYAATCAGQSIAWDELPIQYADYTLWQLRQTDAAGRHDAQLAHWKEALGGVPILELPTDRARPPVQSFRGARRQLLIDAPLRRTLADLSRNTGTPLFMLLLATFELVLARYSGQDDFAVGVPVANRPHPDLERLIGLFVNTVAIRARPRAGTTFRQHLDAVRNEALAAYDHQDVAFEDVVEHVHFPREAGFSPLFQVMFVMQSAIAPDTRALNIELQYEDVDTGASPFDLLMNVLDLPQGLRLSLTYNADLFDAAMPEGLLRDQVRLLEAVTSEPDVTLRSLAASIPLKTLAVNVTSTFDATGLCAPLESWMAALQLPTRVHMSSPAAHVHRWSTLADVLPEIHDAAHLILLREEDVHDHDRGSREGIASLMAGLQKRLQGSGCSALVVLLGADDRSSNDWSAPPGVALLTSQDVSDLYGVHTPWSGPFWSALATAVVRKLIAMHRDPHDDAPLISSDRQACLEAQLKNSEAAVLVIPESERDPAGVVRYFWACDRAGEGSSAQLNSTLHRFMAAFYRRTLQSHVLQDLAMHARRVPDIDRLLARDAVEETDAAFAAPRTPVEERIANLWRQTLGVERVGVHDHFLRLGGNSLAATRLVARLRDAFAIELPLRALFEAPTVAELARLLESRRQDTAASLPPIVPVSRAAALPLSFSQQRLWFLDQLQPGSIAFNMPGALRLRGSLDVPSLERTLNEIVRRHESLRTSFRATEGEPVQAIGPPAPLPLPVKDLSARESREQQTHLTAELRWEAERPFDLAHGPLIRCQLLRLGPTDHVLQVTLHHIVSDAWSIDIFVQEISALYPAYRQGFTSPLPDLPMQYADYSFWQRGLGDALDGQLAYWKRRLHGMSALNLPTDRLRPPVQSQAGGCETLILSPDLRRSIEILSRQHGVTPFMTLLAAFFVLLQRYTRQSDIAIGAPMANRGRAEVEGLIGFFVNTLVLRSEVLGEMTFEALVAAVRELVLEAIAHQDCPFEKLVQELQPERDLSRTPLVQLMFNYVGTPNFLPSLPDLTAEFIDIPRRTSKVDLDLFVEARGDSLHLTMEFNSDLFEAETIAAMLRRYRALLQAVVERPGARVDDLPVLSDVERADISARRKAMLPACRAVWSAADDTECSIPDRFAFHARQHGERLAVAGLGAPLTYRELDEQSDRVGCLMAAAAGEGVPVALLFEPGTDMIAGLLGTLKAGCPYVALDPGYPGERLVSMLEDSGATVILTTSAQHAFAARLAGPARSIVCIDRATTTASAARRTTRAGDLAYILYTSGSSGRPKGVVQNHRNVLHHIRNYATNLGITPDDRLSLLSSYGFDAAVMDIFGALLNGASLHPFSVKKDGLAVIDGMRQAAITIFHSTPTVYRTLIASLTDGRGLPSVRAVVLGGEEVLASDVDLFNAHFDRDCLFVNGLGPTECTVALQNLLTHGAPAPRTSVPVGYPVDGIDLVLLDDNGAPTELFGEIGLRSRHVAVGYWKNETATAAAFVQDPLAPDYRIYRTGDVGRLLPDGTLQFGGRRDYQVKIRGHRVEPGEIEVALRQHPCVADVAVVARDGGAGGKRLVAFVTARDNGAPSATELRSHLSTRLPSFMLPSDYVFLDALPTTPTGKIDRLRLPECATRVEETSSRAAPAGDLERMIAEAWRDVLGVEEVGRDSNFFDLGGHSLLLALVQARLQARLSRDVPMMELFRSPTIATLARALAGTESRTTVTERAEPRGRRQRAAERRQRDRYKERHGILR